MTIHYPLPEILSLMVLKNGRYCVNFNGKTGGLLANLDIFWRQQILEFD